MDMRGPGTVFLSQDREFTGPVSTTPSSPNRHIYTPGMFLDPKPRPQRQRYLRMLADMSPEQRLRKAFELSRWSRELFMAGLRDRFPELGPAALHDLYLERLRKCHSRPS